MDSYLEIAQTVLNASRRPMTAKGILDAAYKARLVPKHLYGKTQAKTLQARLSTDILNHRSTSAFFRTEPGVFFLTALIADPEIPQKFKERFAARRRTRDLHQGPALAIDRSFVEGCNPKLLADWTLFIRSAEVANALHYASSDEKSNMLVVWTFSIVRRGYDVLSYRLGRYRDDHDTFANKRTIGFPGIVSLFDCTLFSDGDYGASENALEAILSDLDISAIAVHGGAISRPKPLRALKVDRDGHDSALLVVMDWTCPEWFEPTTRRLSINDPSWMDTRVKPNNLEDFEPWTLAALDAVASIGNRA
ncbi:MULTISPECIES: winged helix-turn-helix domain-containing protein [Rhizobium]|uniref:winged helix-turn-helix domain-containing protein n=1 Tax=Rhizobium TaxID=379 RepID=UPI00140D2A60|nr:MULTISPECIES: winged helix-turn-helix domain-containing protein [Rhizobium]MDG3576845.1 winged helix-turn-helix domain-containing protein [Rhizobium sp. YJ-22]